MNDFLFVDSAYDREFKAYSADRYPTFKIALNLFHQIHGEIMVETGTTRMANDWGAGMSTVLLGDYCKAYGGKLITVDISEPNIRFCQTATILYKDAIEYVVSDSLKFLAEYSGKPIDLLYLDSFDFPLDEFEDCLPSQEHNLKEFQLAEAKLAKTCILLLDDNDLPRGGKPKLTKQYLLSKPEWKLLFDSHQSLWVRGL